MDKIAGTKEGRWFVVGSSLVRRWYIDGISLVRRSLGRVSVEVRQRFDGGSAEACSPFGALSLGQEEGKKMERNVRTWGRKCSQRGNKLFPAWECFIPSVGINFSPKARFLRNMMLLLIVLMMTFGTTVSWGQTDYSGTYYIANCNDDGYNATNNTGNYYLCPATDYYDGDAGQKPFMSTHKPDANQEDENISKWKITFVCTGDDGTDYYYIKYVAPNGDEKYIVHNEKLVTNLAEQFNLARVRYHLQADKDEVEDNNLFFFTAGVLTKNNKKIYKEFINICSKAEKERENGASLCPAKANTDSYSGQDKGNNTGSFDIDSKNIKCGGLIGHWDENDKTGLWFLEDIIERPVVSINSDGNAEITSSNANATYKYSTDGNTPSTAYDPNNPIDITNVEIIKAIAVVGGEVSNVVTYTVGTGSPNLIQNLECTAFYMVPGAKDNNNNVTLNTSSVASPKMEWYIKNAGAINGLNYYYFVNKSTGHFLYNSGTGTYPPIYIKSCNVILPTDDAYKFFLRPTSDGGYNIFPKGVMDKSFHKDQANGKPEKIVISPNNGDDYPQAHWKFISSIETDKKPLFEVPKDNEGTALTLSSVSDGPSYYFIASSGTADSYIVSNSSDNASTSSSGENTEKSWMLVRTATDPWQTYYHIVSAATGKYMHINTTDNTIEMQDLPNSLSEEVANQYQFVVSRTTTSNTYYIIPKTHYDTFTGNQFYSLYNNSGLTAGFGRQDDNFKWTFEPNSTLFCLDPIATQDNDGNVSLECPTIGAEIHYTDNGDTPDSSSGTFDSSTPWSPTDQAIIKAIAVLKNNTSITSENTITVLNNPDITLSQDTYTYDGTAHEPGITEVGYGGTTVSSSEYSVSSSSYTNNVNAGTANVTLEDVLGDNMYICNASKTFTINPAELAITADAMSKGYGDDDPVLTYTCSGLVEGDGISDVMTGALAREAGEAKGTYAINRGTLDSNTNYTVVTFTGNYLTIEPKSLGSGITLATGITIDDITKTGSVFSTPAIKHNDISLTLGTDYDDPTIIGDATTKYYTVTFTGKGNYTGSVTVRFANVNFGTKNDTEYYATFVTNSSGDSDFAKPADITPYIITGVDDDGTTLVAEALDYIPENVPVLLMTSSSATNGFSVKVRNEGEDAITDDNKLVAATGTDADRTFGAGEIYILYNGEFVLNAPGILAAGKVYLPKSAITGSAPAPARLLIKTRNGLSSIKDASFSSLTTPHSNWYTLDGRRLSGKPTRKGLYLQNGQKVVVK